MADATFQTEALESFRCVVRKVNSDIMECTCNVQFNAILLNLGHYLKRSFIFCCSLWNDRDGRNYTYDQRIQEIRFGGRAGPQHRDEGCESRNSEQPACKTDGRDLFAGPTGERERARIAEFTSICTYFICCYFMGQPWLPLPVRSLIELTQPTQSTPSQPMPT